MAILVRRRILLPLLLLLLLLNLANHDASSQPSPPKVIILNSYHPGFVWSDDEVTGLLERLRQRYPGVVPAIEYLDTKRFPTKDHLLRVKDYLVSKYRGQNVDLVVALDDSALEMILRHRQELFPGVPLIFAGIDDYKTSMLAGQKKVTGVAEVIGIADTLNTALSLHPQTKEVLVVHDYTLTGLISQREIEALLPAFQNRVHIKSSPPASITEIANQIKMLPSNSLVLILSFVTDKEGKTFSPDESTRLLTADLKIPAYATHEARLGHGIVGGYLLGGKDHGRRAGDLALRVLAGEDPSRIPVDMQSTAQPMFDYRQLSRFHIPPSALPAGSTIINRPESFYALHKTMVWGTVSVVITLSLLVFVLSINIIRRRKAEEAWRQSQKRYHNLVKNVPVGLYRSTPGPQGDIFLANPAITRIFGYGSVEEFLQIHAADVYAEPGARQILSDELISQGQVVAKELQFKKKDGTCFWGALTANAVRNESGEIVCFDGFVEDIAEKKLALEGLRTAAQKWRTTFDAIGDAVCLLDPECMIQQCNQAMATIIGKPVEEIIGRRCWELIHGCSQPIEGCPVVRLRQTRRREELILPMGDQLLQVTADPIQDEAGSFAGAVHIISDITQHKRAEEALRQSQEKLLSIFRAAPVGIGVVVNRVIQEANETLCRMTGYAREELVGQKARLLYPTAEDYEYVGREKYRQIAQRGIGIVETRWQLRNGDIINIILSSTPLDAADLSKGVTFTALDITERKLVEEELKASEEKYRLVGDYNYNWEYWIGPNGALIYNSPSCQRITGYAPEEFIANHRLIVDIVHPEDREMVSTHIKEITQEAQGVCELDFRLITKDGEERWVRHVCQPVFGDHGVWLGHRASTRDITARKRMEEKVRVNESRLQTLCTISQYDAENVQNLLDYALDGAIQLTGSKVGYIYHYDEERQVFILNTWSKQVMQECSIIDPQTVYQLDKTGIWGEAVRQRQPIVVNDFESPNPLKKGYPKGHVELSRFMTIPVFVGGKIVAVVGVANKERDYDETDVLQLSLLMDGVWKISERKRAEEAFQVLVNQAPMGIFIVQDGKLEMVNPGFEQVSGYTAGELLGRQGLALVPQDHREAVRKNAIAMLREKLDSAYEFPIITKSGETRWVVGKVTSTIYRGKRAVLGYFLDINEHKSLEGQLILAQKMEAVGRLAGGVAHDFNNLLGVIKGYCDLMDLELNDHDPLVGRVSEIRKAADRAASLTRQLLAFSRKQILQPQVLNINDKITEIKRMIIRLIGEDIEMAVVLDPSLGTVKGDPGQIEQIIMNLVVNARDAMPQGGKLTLKTANVYLDEGYTQRHPYVAPGHYVMLAVTDNGQGMDAATQANVFEPFFTTKEVGKGTGLGLSTVYGIVKQSSGHVQVYSEIGQGTTFKVYLPQVEEAVSTITETKPLDKELRGPETILVVEDDDMLREVILLNLKIYGYKVLEARHGGEALFVCEQHPEPIHLLLTDVVMPKESGRELADHLAPLRPDMKVLYMSGYTENSIVHHGVLDSSISYIQKPFSPLALVEQIRKILD